MARYGREYRRRIGGRGWAGGPPGYGWGGRRRAPRGRPARMPEWYGRDYGRAGDYDIEFERGYGGERMGDVRMGGVPEAMRRPVDERGHTPPDRWPGIGHDIRTRVREARRVDDDEICDGVLENLFQDTWIDPDRIDVDVDRGVVILLGEVDDFMQARYAWDDAWETPGVRGVINNLAVRTDVPREEMDLPQSAGDMPAPPSGRSRRRRYRG